MGLKKLNRVLVKPGDRFQEYDKRFFRVVEVVAVVNDRVQIRTLTPTFSGKLSTRLTLARRDRFDRRSGGYVYLYGKCHQCQIELGGVVPAWGHRGVTCTLGTCSRCLKPNASLVPSSDYHWPKENKKAIWD